MGNEVPTPCVPQDRDALNYISPRDYRHWHKLHTITTGWNIMGKVEVRVTTEALQPMVEGYDEGDKNIYREHTCSTWDNHFSDNRIME